MLKLRIIFDLSLYINFLINIFYYLICKVNLTIPRTLRSDDSRDWFEKCGTPKFSETEFSIYSNLYKNMY